MTEGVRDPSVLREALMRGLLCAPALAFAFPLPVERLAREFGGGPVVLVASMAGVIMGAFVALATAIERHEARVRSPRTSRRALAAALFAGLITILGFWIASFQAVYFGGVAASLSLTGGLD